MNMAEISYNIYGNICGIMHTTLDRSRKAFGKPELHTIPSELCQKHRHTNHSFAPFLCVKT